MNKLKGSAKHANKTKKKRLLRGGTIGEDQNSKKYYNRIIKNTRKKKLNVHLQNREKNFSKLLQVACKNPDNCLAIGPYDASIKMFFENFRDLFYIDEPNVKRIGTPSANGFVIELPFKKLNYTAYTALKCSASAKSDNLAYEYFVGKHFINTYVKKLPCFVETYDLYEFANEADYTTVYNAVQNKTINTVDIPSLIHRVDDENMTFGELFNKSCVKNKQMCILIQHFDKFNSFYDLKTNDHDNVKYDVFNMYYQLYYGLCYLGPKYTHYDLHLNNVFLYKPFDGNKYILMRYHSKNKVFEFKSEYILKIIDYGRNYFDNGSITSANIIKDFICKDASCGASCGEDVGYSIIQGSADPAFGNFHWIDPTKPNMSHDLRAVHQLSYIFAPNKIVYVDNYGTPENNTGNEAVIKNIYNLKDALESSIDTFNLYKSHKKYDSSWQHAATMDIYDDGRDYDFTVVPESVNPILTPPTPSAVPPQTSQPIPIPQAAPAPSNPASASVPVVTASTSPQNSLSVSSSSSNPISATVPYP